MIISLIGMSGAGKSFWAKMLESTGFRRFSADDLIGEKLEKKIKDFKYNNGTSTLAEWMGNPYDPQYPRTSLIYLSLEEEVMEEVFKNLALLSNKKLNIVVDTSGSVIHLSQEILKKLSVLTKVIYLKVSKEKERQMYELFLKEPKPLIWGGLYTRQSGENIEQATTRSYLELLNYRAGQYEKLAHETVENSILKDPLFTVEKFITQIRDDQALVQL